MNRQPPPSRSKKGNVGTVSSSSRAAKAGNNIVPEPVVERTPAVGTGGEFAEVVDLTPLDLDQFIGVDLEILSVSPDTPMEKTPIKITFQLTDRFPSRPLNGQVQFLGDVTSVGPSTYQVDDLLPGQTIRGFVWGIAPLAGHDVQIRIVYEEPSPGVRFGSVIGAQPAAFVQSTAGTEIDIKAQYQLFVDWLKVLNPRALDDDTLVGQCTAHFGDTVLQPAMPARPNEFVDSMTATYGDHGSGDTVQTGFLFETFEGVPGVALPLDFNYIFANAGGTDTDEQKAKQWLDGLAAAGGAVASVVYPAGTPVWTVAVAALTKFFDFLFPDCDGPVAVDRFVLTSSKLDQLTRNGSLEQLNFYTGTDSPAVCGETSHYLVHFYISRPSNWHPIM
jgi:hypothetical protein